MTAERVDASLSAATRTWPLFAWVLFTALAINAAALLESPLSPAFSRVAGASRVAVLLAAGFAGVARGARLVRVVGACWGGLMLATLLTVSVYVLTGRAAADGFGPAVVVALLLGGAVGGLALPLAGGAASLALRRLRPARG